MEQDTACFGQRQEIYRERAAMKCQAGKTVDADEEKMREKTDADIQTRFEQAAESGEETAPDYGSATQSESEPFQVSIDFWGCSLSRRRAMPHSDERIVTQELSRYQH
jgi:hypothetical protein